MLTNLKNITTKNVKGKKEIILNLSNEAEYIHQ